MLFYQVGLSSSDISGRGVVVRCGSSSTNSSDRCRGSSGSSSRSLKKEVAVVAALLSLLNWYHHCHLWAGGSG